jgi:hypothetical protein
LRGSEEEWETQREEERREIKMKIGDSPQVTQKHRNIGISTNDITHN